MASTKDTQILTKCFFYTRLETRLKECTNYASRGAKKPRGEMKVMAGNRRRLEAVSAAQPGDLAPIWGPVHFEHKSYDPKDV
jgi:hypothetical protein